MSSLSLGLFVETTMRIVGEVQIAEKTFPTFRWDGKSLDQ